MKESVAETFGMFSAPRTLPPASLIVSTPAVAS
jgi:hypothetical protein